jgi:hypothetical protein
MLLSEARWFWVFIFLLLTYVAERSEAVLFLDFVVYYLLFLLPNVVRYILRRRVSSEAREKGVGYTPFQA